MRKVSPHTASPTKFNTRKCWSSNKQHRNHSDPSHYNTLVECPRCPLEHMRDFNCSWILQDFLQIILLRIIGNDGRQTTSLRFDRLWLWRYHDRSFPRPAAWYTRERGIIACLHSEPKRQAGERSKDWLPNSSCWQPILQICNRRQRIGRSRSFHPTFPLKHVTPCMKLKQLSHLRHVLFPEVERKKVSILIGTSLQEAFIPLEVKKGKSNEPFAIRSYLGWSSLGGSVSVSSKRHFNLNHVSSVRCSS